jgi:alkaline phosphatase D
MKTTRRSFLRTAAMLSTQPLILGGLQACGDDGETVTPQPDAGGDGFDMDGSAMTDGSADADTEVPDEPDTLPQYEYTGEPGPETLFSHGVASGDPLQDAVIIWTRVTPEVEGPAEVWYEVSRDVDFTRRVEVGTFTTGPERDYTVKYDAVGLEPGRTYYFRFKYLGRTSIVGRMRTAPVGDVSKLRFAVCSCSSWGHGYFHAYRGIGERNDLAAVLHLGDYIYEYGTNEYGRIREYEPANEIVSLSDYRTRYAQYRTDENLQFMHQQHPIIAVWDDHETADNSWRDGANNHSEGSEGTWADRKAAAFQAYMEWMPIREQEEFKIWRSFNYGNLLDLVMLDTRIWGRDLEVAGSDIEGINAPGRQLLGADQEAWVLQTLEESSARWKVIGQQVMVGNWKSFGGLDSEGGGGVTNGDQWDGYRPARKKFFDAIESTDAGTVVVLTGDIHSSWAHNLAPDPNNPESYNPTTFEGSIAVEYVVPGISSPGFPRAVGEAFVLTAKDNNPTLQWAELANRGYLVLDVTPERVQGAWFHYEDVIDPDPTAFPEFFQAAWATDYGTGYLVEDSAPADPIADAPDLV